MTTARLYADPGRPTVSFEIFPPRTPAAAEGLWRTVGHLAAAGPDYISVTFGASGSTRESSRGLVRAILRETPVTAVAHLTCVGVSRAEVAALVAGFLDEGVRSILALRGDPPKDQPDWQPHPEGLRYASELVALIRQIEQDRRPRAGHVGPGSPARDLHGLGWQGSGPAVPRLGPAPTAATRGPADVDPAEPLSIAVAAYPGAASSPTRRDDVAALLAKQEAGADYALTQVFYDPAAYAGLVRDARAAGVHIPIVPGLIPMTDPGRLGRLQGLTGVEPPADLMARLVGEEDPLARHRLGIRASVDLAHAVLDAGAPGLHLYTFNKHEAALDLLEGVDLDGPARAARDLAAGSWARPTPIPSAQGRR